MRLSAAPRDQPLNHTYRASYFTPNPMKNKTFSSEIIADSINEFGHRLTTFVITFPRMILAEFNTHRMLSRNSASSRAIPFKTMLYRVEENPFIPIRWMKDHKGMQGNEYFEDVKEIENLRGTWLRARRDAIASANILYGMGVTKQFCNRLLEPFMWHTVIVTASEWENFFALRVHEAAEIHMQKIASMMLKNYNASTPKQLEEGDWHIPFGDKIDGVRIQQTFDPVTSSGELEEYKVKIATARCARVSYLNYDGNDDYEADVKLHDRLSGMGHWSPFEHCARAMSLLELETNYKTDMSPEGNHQLQSGWSGNFRGFIQYRKTFKGENATDIRVKK